MRKNKLTNRLFFLLDNLGLTIIVSKFFYWLNNIRYYYSNNEKMNKSKNYFFSHKTDIQKVVSFLCDEKSKTTYLRMIDFRSSFDNRILPEYSYKNQYFGNTFFKYKENEIFIDCGSWDGDTIRYFKKVMKKKDIKNWKCIAFEPDDENYLALKRNYPDIIAFKSGVGDRTKKQLFLMNNNGSSCFVDDCNNNYQKTKLYYIDVRKLDDVEECKNATFIKMDIEGAEFEALLGAENLIKKNKPKLAICIYHKDEDFVRIPLLIKEWVPEYKLYVMQHSNTIYETVLYATL